MYEYITTEIVYWQWLVFGLTMLAIEMVFPGAFFIWIGAAALITSFMAYLFDWLIVAQILTFSLACLVTLSLGARVYRGLEVWEKKPGQLNRRADQMVGQIVVLSDPIVNGEAHVLIGDTRWKVHGPDTEAGVQVVIVEVVGNKLIVEPY